ncbi:hypothetical protein Tco_0523041 [Tanacetum coccineum]
MAFISSSNTSSGKGKVPIASVPTASSQVSTVSTEIDKDDIEEMDIKWNLAFICRGAAAPLSAASGRECIDGMANEDENHALMADDVVLTEFTLMAMSSSSSSSDNEVYDDSYCSKSCRKNTENLNTKINKLNEELSDCKTDLYNYKRGLSQVEARLVEFKVNKTKFCERIRVLERDVEIRDNKIKSLKNELEELKKEKESIYHKLAGFVYSPPQRDLSWTCLPEFVDDTVIDYTRPTPSVDVSKDVRSDLDGNNTSILVQGEVTLVLKVPTGRTKIPTVGSNVPTAKPTGAADLRNNGKAIKALARWICKPKENTSGQGTDISQKDKKPSKKATKPDTGWKSV